ncbi:hypothetical protein [Pantoea ananatis]|uniref:hypothetical protein n=1 Tax=Pantoea ananas TaxID=553 RepID=UPI00030FD342|nr:hypothetical protein [Pantoea ananatis]
MLHSPQVSKPLPAVVVPAQARPQHTSDIQQRAGVRILSADVQQKMPQSAAFGETVVG